MPRHNGPLNQARDLEHRENVQQALHASSSTQASPDGATAFYLDPADARQLRGIPAIGGRGTLGGAIAGTRPDTIHHDHLRRKPWN